MNRTVAVSMVSGPAQALEEIAESEKDGRLTNYQYPPAIKADLLRRLGRSQEAAIAYRQAPELTENDAEREFPAERLASPHPRMPRDQASTGRLPGLVLLQAQGDHDGCGDENSGDFCKRHFHPGSRWRGSGECGRGETPTWRMDLAGFGWPTTSISPSRDTSTVVQRGGGVELSSPGFPYAQS
ncbi:hypothetical protein [Streptomyces sp. NPDC002088]|uniref:hypothetical protein n=1 Tax=Streptomyces sp. NPDC002088 TaxID=3154665 RepID=UPI003325722D